MIQKFIQDVESYLSGRLGWRQVKIHDARQLAGGISRATWKVSLEMLSDGGRKVERDLIVRVDPEASLLSSGRKIECAMCRAFAEVPGVPVPEVICNEDDPSFLGAPFMVTAALPGVADIPAILFPPFSAVGSGIGRALFEILGRVSLVDPREKNLESVVPTTSCATAWSDELKRWETTLQRYSLGPSPITQAAIRYLKRNPPPPARRVSVVHGDYRLGNCLYLPDGSIAGVLDWEMAHLGDPLEDLAWALMRDWRPSAALDKVAGHLEYGEAVGAWEAASGLRADPAALKWWALFSHVKSIGIFTTGGYNFLSADSTDLTYAVISWAALHAQESYMIELMEELR
ncbi:MAG: phosphotransferase family protein [Desulfuromonadaceae bacterium]|nr:phosphotransferase family protein [Desulfuromonadaceae bacterium]